MIYEVRCRKGSIDVTFKFHDEYYANKTKEDKQKDGFQVDITIKNED